MLNYAFHYFPQLEVVPIFTAAAMISNQTVGGIAMKEFKEFDGMGFMNFILGSAICVIGILVMMYFD